MGALGTNGLNFSSDIHILEYLKEKIPIFFLFHSCRK